MVFRARRLTHFPLVLAGGSRHGAGVRVDQVVGDPAPPSTAISRDIPTRDAKGYVAYPAINPVEEMTDLLGAVRAYELNASAVQATKTMITAVARSPALNQLGSAADARKTSRWSKLDRMPVSGIAVNPAISRAAGAGHGGAREWGFVETLRGAMDQVNQLQSRPTSKVGACSKATGWMCTAP